ncbi:MAG: DUF5615 family PIN-like protein [Myxococcota bacterium]
MRSVLAIGNVPRVAVHVLREAGLDVRSASEDMPGAVDAAVLERVRAEDRLLPTFDRDYGELVFHRRREPPAAVVFLRFVSATPAEPASVFQNLLGHDAVELESRFTVVTREQVRQRPLPQAVHRITVR